LAPASYHWMDWIAMAIVAAGYAMAACGACICSVALLRGEQKLHRAGRRLGLAALLVVSAGIIGAGAARMVGCGRLLAASGFMPAVVGLVLLVPPIHPQHAGNVAQSTLDVVLTWLAVLAGVWGVLGMLSVFG
jgi:hypothetical protein